MRITRRGVMQAGVALAASAATAAPADVPLVRLDTAMAPPEWALLQRQVIQANADACAAMFARYFDADGRFLCFERWGANDGPDDAIENVNNYALLHALGAPDSVRAMMARAQEGNFRQYTRARTVEAPLGRQGMYYRDFPTQMDWQHLSEGLSTFNLMGLSMPRDAAYRARARRFAGFYTGEDPSAPNYDRARRLIRSGFTGSRGPLLRRATPLDWAGDPFEAGARFFMEHGETTYQQTLDHYRDYTETLGDSPLNLQATSLGLTAYMLDGEPNYRRWLLDYCDAWIDRARANNDMLPSNIGRDGAIGGDAGGKWWGGVYGWGFSPIVPQTGKREDRNRVIRAITGFMNAYLVTGDDRYLDVWRRQADRIDAAGRTVNGQLQTPTMYGDQGWYSYRPGRFSAGMLEVYYLSMRASDRARAPAHPWLDYLDGKNPAYPETALRKDLAEIAERLAKMRADTSTPETRLADRALDWTPATVTSLIAQMLGGIHIARPGWAPSSPAQGGVPLHCRLRYFDPVARRAGVPDGVATLVDRLEGDRTGVTLVNTGAQPRTLIVQGGAYGEHQLVSISRAGRAPVAVGAPIATIALAPGAGERIDIAMRRYANQPRIDFPWDRRQ